MSNDVADPASRFEPPRLFTEPPADVKAHIDFGGVRDGDQAPLSLIGDGGLMWGAETLHALAAPLPRRNGLTFRLTRRGGAFNLLVIRAGNGRGRVARRRLLGDGLHPLPLRPPIQRRSGGSGFR